MLRLGLGLGAGMAGAFAVSGCASMGVVAALGLSPGPLGLATVACCAGGACAGVIGVGARKGWVAKSLALLPFIPFWTRFTRSTVMEHPRRAQILALVRERPGATTLAIQEISGANEGTLLYHLRALERAGYVRSMRLGRDRVWYEAAAAPIDPAVARVLHAPSRQAILERVRAEPGLTQSALARGLALSKTTVSHHVRELAAARLVEVRRDGLRARCYPA